MKYISTRGDTDPKPFSEVLLMGLAPDGGSLNSGLDMGNSLVKAVWTINAAPN